ncbi:GNAT family N-acetyltransferase [Chryseomicrobium excrementi]|uniref:GNAT family N-acetyltransferase n=1 Tax=Chryseomicrobium excrementi TaxID=2041346 RepID=A0A2M9EYB4_9BACL|nr:GNAT family N-acetyltransferase [Chryseomicrobium excrementi]PJK16199.1 GNAT family N-acetyltransferase [Chryseomicrobium excrementi]
MVNDYEVLYTTPTLDEYINLCSSVGWKDHMNFEVAEASLRNSVFSVIIKDNNKVIGMGRIVGDGAIYYYIQDIVVHPKYQGYGIGKEIMNTLMSYIENNAPNKAFIGLFASEGKVDFYEKYHFKDYSPNMTGMFKVNLK